MARLFPATSNGISAARRLAAPDSAADPAGAGMGRRPPAEHPKGRLAGFQIGTGRTRLDVHMFEALMGLYEATNRGSLGHDHRRNGRNGEGL